MELNLKGMRVLVTGGAGGMGTAICRMLGDEGCSVMVHDLPSRAADASTIVEQIISGGGDAVSATADLANIKEVDDLARVAGEWRSGIDILVTTAATLSGPAQLPWLEIPDDRYLDCYKVNTLAPMTLVRHLVPSMVERGFGRFIFISSMSGVRPSGVEPHYIASKAALNALSISLTKAYPRSGISAVTLSPGPIVTPLMEDTLRRMAERLGWEGEWEELQARAATEIWRLTSKRLGTPADIARAVAFMASPLNTFITGVNLRICGGSTSEVH
jgi:3-oxoacyl-[acyl-carrier protein] reductase